MADSTKSKKALEDELEFYRNKSKLKDGWCRLDLNVKRSLVVVAVAFLLISAIAFYISFRTIAEPEMLSDESYRALLAAKSGSCWQLSDKDRPFFRELLQLPSLSRKVSIGSSDDILYLIFTDGIISAEYPFRLDSGVICGRISGKDFRLYFTESASGDGMALSIYSDGIESELKPYSEKLQ